MLRAALKSSSQQNLDPREKFFGREGFGQLVIGAGAKPPDFVGCLIAGSEHQNRSGNALLPEGLANFKPIGIRQHDVHNNEIEALTEDSVFGIESGTDAIGAVPIVFQQIDQNHAKRRFVLDNKNPVLVPMLH